MWILPLSLNAIAGTLTGVLEYVTLEYMEYAQPVQMCLVDLEKT